MPGNFTAASDEIATVCQPTPACDGLSTFVILGVAAVLTGLLKAAVIEWEVRD